MHRTSTTLGPTILVAALVGAASLAAVSAAAGSGTAGTADGEIVFASRRDGDSEIYAIRPDGTGLRKLTDNRAGDYAPAWSPDGRLIAFVSDRGGSEDVYVMNRDGGGLRRVTRAAASELSPAWSPDGAMIAFARVRQQGAEIVVARAGGGGEKRISPAAVRGYGSYSPAWSPDGRRIAFAGSFATPENQEIYSVRPDGTGLRRLTHTLGDIERLGDDAMPDWSPDGRQIAFTSNRNGDGELWVMRADGSGERRFAGLPRRDDWSPSWSPGGRSLTFTSLGAGESSIGIVRRDGTGLRLLTDGDEPDWSPPPAR